MSRADVNAFRAAAGLNANAPTVQVVPLTPYGGCDPGTPSSPTRCLNRPPTSSDLAESSIDVEWSGAMAPYATVFFINSQNVFLSMQYAVNTNVAPIVTTSYGNCEAAWGITDLSSFNQVFLSRDPEARVRDIAAAVGITERATQAILGELEADGYLTRVKVGRRNRYEIHPELTFRHPAESGRPIGELLRIFE